MGAANSMPIGGSRTGDWACHARNVPTGEAVSRSFYATLGAERLRRRSRPEWDAAIAESAAAYLGERERVLDAGCGYGRIAIPLATRGYRVTGLDLSELLLHNAREAALVQGVRLPLAVGSMARLPFRDPYRRAPAACTGHRAARGPDQPRHSRGLAEPALHPRPGNAKQPLHARRH